VLPFKKRSQIEETIVQWKITANPAKNMIFVSLQYQALSSGRTGPLYRFTVCPMSFPVFFERLEKHGLQPEIERRLLSDLTQLACRLHLTGFPMIRRRTRCLWDRIEEISSGSPI
jgi:hypothetical protein